MEPFGISTRNGIDPVLDLMEELTKRKATIEDFFIAYVASKADNVNAVLRYLDSTRIKEPDK